MDDSRFRELFRGSELSHGEWVAERPQPAATIKGEAREQDYDDHLNGRRGLGLVPVRKDGTCVFGAIDIDDDRIDHRALYAKVAVERLPLNVCRSKSGGAHLYPFFSAPQKAGEVIVVMRQWAARLGWPKAEVFPKQTKINGANLGNWINLPYFGAMAGETTRYAIGPGGALSFEEFLSGVVRCENFSTPPPVSNKGDVLIQITDAPPCLKILARDGIYAGNRNEVLFNLAIFFRKKNPEGWEPAILDFNKQHVHPPLPWRELQSVIRSAQLKTYQYTCNQHPLCDNCDRPTCETLRYGVSCMPWHEQGAFDEPDLGNLRKISTDPPTYLLRVDDRDVSLDAEQLYDFRKFKRRVFEMLDLVMAQIKQDRWDLTVRGLLQDKVDVQAPEDASHQGLILVAVQEFLSRHQRCLTRDGILKGLPWSDGQKIYFRVSDLFQYFRQHYLLVKEENLYHLLHQQGCGSQKLRIAGQVTHVWVAPLTLVPPPPEEFEPPNLEDLKGEV